MTIKVYVKFFKYSVNPDLNYFYISNEENSSFLLCENDYLRRNGVWHRQTYSTVGQPQGPDSGAFGTAAEAIVTAKYYGYEVIDTTAEKTVTP